MLYEMMAGRPPFVSEHEQATIYSIINEDPEPLTAVRTGLPTELDRIVFKGLAKKPEERYQHVDDMLVDLRRLQKKLEADSSTTPRTGPAVKDVGARHAVPAAPEGTTGTRAQHAVPLHSGGEASEHPLVKYRVIENLEEQGDQVTYRAEDTQLHRSVAIRVVPESEANKLEKRRQLQRRGMFGIAVLVVLSLAFGVSQWLAKPSATGTMPLRKFSFAPPERLSLQFAFSPVAVSPDGGHVAFVAGDARTLWIRDLANEQAREIQGTENARYPFWSPDSEFIGFGTDKELKKISVEGAATITLCELPHRLYLDGAWSPDGDSIVFSSDNPPPSSMKCRLAAEPRSCSSSRKSRRRGRAQSSRISCPRKQRLAVCFLPKVRSEIRRLFSRTSKPASGCLWEPDRFLGMPRLGILCIRPITKKAGSGRCPSRFRRYSRPARRSRLRKMWVSRA